MNNSKKNRNEEPFGFLMKSINQFFNERPAKGFLQAMDDLFHDPFHIEVSEEENEYVINAELPGVNREQIKLDVVDRYITIFVHSSSALIEENDDQKIIRQQQSMQRTSRTISLMHPISVKKVKASYENGLLQIRAPKQKGKQILLD